MKVFLLLLLWVANTIAVAQGPVAPDLAPQTYKLLFENKKVRVIEEHLKPHEKEPMHSHPYGVLACFLTDAHFRTIVSDGKAAEGSQKAGDTVWRDPVTHSGENIGDAEIDEIMIEPKSASGERVKNPPYSSAQECGTYNVPHYKRRILALISQTAHLHVCIRLNWAQPLVKILP